MVTLESIRRSISEMGKRGRGHAYPEPLRTEIIEYAAARRAAGVKIDTIGEELGIPWRTLVRWMPRVRKGRFRPVEIADKVEALKVSPSVTPGPVVHGPRGLRIEGLDLEGLAELVRRLG